jgi:hypothetical protein
MSVCLNLFDRAKYRTAKGGEKAHVGLDYKTILPDMSNITEAKVSDRRGADNSTYPKDTIVVNDRGYFDFKLSLKQIDDQNIFVTRIKPNTLYKHANELELPGDKDFEILKDEVVHLSDKQAVETGINKIGLRKIAVIVEETDRITKKKQIKTLEPITNNLTWEASTIVELYRRRWLIETFFKLLKQNIEIKNFLGVNENSNKSQIFIALISYFLTGLIRRSISKANHRFGHFITIIRACLLQYKILQYIATDIKIVVTKAKKYDLKTLTQPK